MRPSLFALGLLVACGCSSSDASAPPGPAAPEPVVPAPASGAMLPVPGAIFIMGCNEPLDTKCNPNNDERPRHQVTVRGFSLEVTEVTEADYKKCVDAGKCKVPAPPPGNFPLFDPVKRARHPVTNVNWESAQAYCAWAGKRLPTEAEWELAARGTDGRLYPWGNDAPDCSRANFGAPGGACTGGTATVASYARNIGPYGHYDLAGNVWEWVNDVYDAGYYATSPANDPEGPTSTNVDATHAKRGAGWVDPVERLRTSQRLTHIPPHTGDPYIGIRCAKDAP